MDAKYTVQYQISMKTHHKQATEAVQVGSAGKDKKSRYITESNIERLEESD